MSETTERVKEPDAGTAGCPFCKSSCLQVFSGEDTVAPMGFAIMRCLGCGAIVSFMEHRTEASLIEAWNRRERGEEDADA